MEEQFSRTAMLLGEEGVARLRQARVAVFGLGGVGGYFLLFINKANVAKEMSTIRNWNSPSYVTTFIRTTPFP